MDMHDYLIKYIPLRQWSLTIYGGAPRQQDWQG